MCKAAALIPTDSQTSAVSLERQPTKAEANCCSLQDRVDFQFAERAVNPQFSSASSHTHELGSGLSGRGCVADLESPFPQARFDQEKG
jgi:hypothetical protein